MGDFLLFQYIRGVSHETNINSHICVSSLARMSSSAEATLPSRASSRLEVIVGAAILNFDITSGDCVERKLGSLGAIADDRLSALAVPEGSHHVPEDCTYFLTASFRRPAAAFWSIGIPESA